MMENHSCENTKRIEDWMCHCRDQHEQLNRLLHEIHAALYGNGREGLMERVKSHSQRIAMVDSDVRDLRKDVDTKFGGLSSKIDGLTGKFWRMAIIVGVLVATVSKATSAIDLRTIIGL